MSNGLTGRPRLEPRDRPRGALHVTDTMRAAARQCREGTPRADLARLYRVSVHTINAWVLRVTEAEREERLQKAAGQ